MTNHLDETAGRRPERLQGFGTYTYVCNKPDCVFCEKMNPKTSDAVINPFERNSTVWTFEQDNWLAKNYTLFKIEYVVAYMGRTKVAIENRVSKLRTTGYHIGKKKNRLKGYKLPKMQNLLRNNYNDPV